MKITDNTALLAVALSCFITLLSQGSEPHQATWNFDSASAGTMPDGWSIRETNPNDATASWQVVVDPTAPSKPNALAITQTRNHGSAFNLAIAESTSFRNLDLTVSVKATTGDEDQGGGPIWRCKDENNYYVCRFNPLESNFRVYYVKNGKREQLQSATVSTQADTWYNIRVTMIGDHITCSLDGKKLLDVKDDTFPNAGSVGLWSKADAATRFDDVRVTETGTAVITDKNELEQNE